MRKIIAKIILYLSILGFIFLLGFLLYLDPFLVGILYSIFAFCLLLSFSIIELFGSDINRYRPSNK